jgi:biotin carboxyl carrier protein
VQVLSTRVEPGSARYQRNRDHFLREIALLREDVMGGFAAPMTGIVRKVRVAVGDRVVAGQMVDPDEILVVVDADPVDPVGSEEPA